MAKESGMGMTVGVDDSAGVLRQIENDCLTIGWNQTQALQDVTGVDKSAMERLILLGDFQVTLTGIFNDAANLSLAVFKTMSGTRTVTIAHSGQTLTNECLEDHFNFSRGNDGSLGWDAGLMLQSGTVPVWA